MNSLKTYLTFLFFTLGICFVLAVTPFTADAKLNPEFYSQRLLYLLNTGFFLLPMVGVLLTGILYAFFIKKLQAQDLRIIGLHVLAAPFLTSVFFLVAFAPIEFSLIVAFHSIMAVIFLGGGFYFHRQSALHKA